MSASNDEFSALNQEETLSVSSYMNGVGPSHFLQRAFAPSEKKIYIYGGENSSGFWTNNLTVVDNESSKTVTWKKQKCFDFPPKIDSHSIAVFENTLLVFGGSDNQWINGGNNSIYQLNLDTMQWSVLNENDQQDVNQIPSGRKDHSTTVVGDKMYIYGGVSSEVDSDKVFSDVYLFEIGSRLWRKLETVGESVPLPRSGHSMIYDSISDSLIVFGGRLENGVYSNEVWSLAVSSLTWTLICTTGNVPIGRENHSALEMNNSMVVYGGWTIGGPQNDLFSLDLRNNEWKKYSHTMESETNSKRFGHTSAVLDGVLMIYGGKNHLFNNQEEVLSFQFNQLTEDPLEIVKPKSERVMEELVLDIDEKTLSEELFKKPQFSTTDVSLYKNIFDQLTNENIKQYEELNSILLKQKFFSLQVENLIETNKTLKAPEYVLPNPTIVFEAVETPQTFKTLLKEVFEAQDTKTNSVSVSSPEFSIDEKSETVNGNVEEKTSPRVPEPLTVDIEEQELVKTDAEQKEEEASTVAESNLGKESLRAEINQKEEQEPSHESLELKTEKKLERSEESTSEKQVSPESVKNEDKQASPTSSLVKSGEARVETSPKTLPTSPKKNNKKNNNKKKR